MNQASIHDYLVNETVDIKHNRATNEVVVVENGKEIFKKPYTKENIALAQQIYMGAKYKEVEKQND